MISGVLAVLATAGWIAFIASAVKDRKRVAEMDEAERQLTECKAFNHNLSREVARLNEAMNLNKL